MLPANYNPSLKIFGLPLHGLLSDQPGYRYPGAMSLSPFVFDQNDNVVALTAPGIARSTAQGLLEGIQAPRRVLQGEVDPMTGAMLTAGAAPVGSLLVPAPAGAVGMNVFHGTPHRFAPEPGFPQGRPRLDMMGTGEGAQAYGPGFYSAESGGVGAQYRNALSYKDTVQKFRDALPDDADFEDVTGLLGTGQFSAPQEAVIRALRDDDWLGFDYPSQAISAAYGRNLDNFDPSPALREAVQATGNLYKLDIPDADAAKLLDYDAPISQQPKAVRDAIDRLGFMPDNPDKMAGGDVWYRMRQQLGEDEAAAAMRGAGVPGLRYKDAGSRGTDSARGTRNFVVWDQDVLDRTRILQRNDEALYPDLDNFFLNMGEDGAGMEFPEVFSGIDRYVMDVDPKGLVDAVRSADYPAYKQVMQANLERLFPQGSIPVKRVDGYGRGPDVAQQTKNFEVDPKDVVLVGGESEKELIIDGANYGYNRMVSVRITPEGLFSNAKPAAAAGGLLNAAAQRQADMPGGSPAKSMYDLPAGSDPRYLGAAPDRSEFTFLRYRPKKNTPRVEASLAAMRDPGNATRQQLEADIKRGIELGGADWYNTEELRDWFIGELGEVEGNRQWAEYMDLMGAASPGSKVPANIANASEIRRRLYSQEMPRNSNMTEGEQYRDSLLGIEKLDDARDVARGRTKGYGHKTQGLQELIASRQQKGTWSGDPETGVSPAQGNWTENPKPKGFAQSLKGSGRNIAADLHFTRYMAMASRDPRWLSTQAEIGSATAQSLRKKYGKKIAPYFSERDVDGKTQITFNPKKAVKDGKMSAEDVADLKVPQMWADKPNDSEYDAFEAFMYEVGEEMGLTGPQTQAALWMGAADRTGVDPTSQGTFMELFRRRADERAAKEGMTREDVIRRFIRDKGLMSNPASAAIPGLLIGNPAITQQQMQSLLADPYGA